jgi:N-acyl-D-aspartate/D-glutamate deacylase
MTRFDIAINSGLLFDGTGRPARVQSIGIRGARVAELRDEPISAEEANERIDAQDKWVMPGFLDIHTHYDAEVEAAPGLTESLRHGVTTVTFGSCSLGTVLSSPVDIADMFTRVEAVPYEFVLPLFEAKKNWTTPAQYRAHLETLALGPNVTAFLGHSDLRAHVMGLHRAIARGESPTDEELATMETLVGDALDAGFLGLSLNTNRWDKLGGRAHRSSPLPSTFARWSEIRRLLRPVRKRGRVMQGLPNISTKYDLFLFLWESIGVARPPLKTTLVSLLDVRTNRLLYRLVGALARLINRFLRGDVRFQALPTPFELFADGIDAPVFEEFGAGTAALHLADLTERSELLRDAKYRRWFRRQWTNWLLPHVFHRDFNESEIVACPDGALVGKSFAEVARQRGESALDVFLDLCAEHGPRLRWFTIIGNDRPFALRHIAAHPDVLLGFSDAGAHLRNMAYYNFPLRMLKLVRDAARDGIPFMSTEKAVWRLTGEIAEWLDLDAGRLAPGGRADVAIIDPQGLTSAVEDHVEALMPEFGDYRRMVRRNDAAVTAVLVGGRVAVKNGVPVADLGRMKLGTFLGAGERDPAALGHPDARSVRTGRANGFEQRIHSDGFSQPSE